MVTRPNEYDDFSSCDHAWYANKPHGQTGWIQAISIITIFLSNDHHECKQATWLTGMNNLILYDLNVTEF